MRAHVPERSRRRRAANLHPASRAPRPPGNPVTAQPKHQPAPPTGNGNRPRFSRPRDVPAGDTRTCMPYSGNTSTRVHLRRSPSQDVHVSPPESRPVAVLSCCTPPSLHPYTERAQLPETHASHGSRLYPSAGQDRRRRADLALLDDECVPPAIMLHAGRTGTAVTRHLTSNGRPAGLMG